MYYTVTGSSRLLNIFRFITLRLIHRIYKATQLQHKDVYSCIQEAINLNVFLRVV